MLEHDQAHFFARSLRSVPLARSPHYGALEHWITAEYLALFKLDIRDDFVESIPDTVKIGATRYGLVCGTTDNATLYNDPLTRFIGIHSFLRAELCFVLREILPENV